MKTKRIALFGMLVAVAFIFSYIEHLIPLPLPTGVKLGAANIVILCALYFLGWKEALAVSMVRIVLSGFAFGFSTVPYSLAGGLLSMLAMVLLKRAKGFGITGVSVAGSVCHNIGQTIVAMLLLGSKTVYYFPLLLFSGIIAGILIGLVSGLIVTKLKGHIRV
ncbi:MAG: Gx transporter family protein [Lachnospiraceae bacterium]|nr:Gx transporter family protein [Lachnospiraceae bacterium]MBP3578631.1 Gx transporter family protein [Lachnospiraceae bacterium]